MESYRSQIIEDKDLWEGYIASRTEANFLQSWYWGEFHKALGKKIYRIGIFHADELRGVMLLIVEPARRGKHIIVPGGPLITWETFELAQAVAKVLRQIAKDENAVFVRIRPQLPDTHAARLLMEDLHFNPALTHLHAELTNELDLSPTRDELLMQMRKQTRAEVKKADKLGIEIRVTDSPEAIQEFYDLQMETAKRQGFVPFSYEFLFEQFKVFAQAGHAKLYSAYYDDKLLAQAFIIFYGTEAAYHYGASSQWGREYPGAYALQWRIIQDAKELGMHTYNLWGVAKEEEKNHRFYPISIFKRGFGGSDRSYLHAHDLIVDYPRYFLTYVVEFTRKKMRRL